MNFLFWLITYILLEDIPPPSKFKYPLSASRPFVHIEQGDEVFVPPMQPFTISCNVTRADPPATITWQHKLVSEG